MADYISKYSGTQIDLAVASGSTTTNKIIVTGDISASAGNLSGVDLYLSGDDIYNDNTKRLTLGATNEFVGNLSGSATSTGSFGLIQTNTIENNGQIVISASASDVELGAKDDVVIFAQDDVKINSMDTTYVEARDDVRLLANNDIRLDCAQDGGGDIRIRFNDKNLLTNTGSGSLNVGADVNLSGSATTTGSMGSLQIDGASVDFTGLPTSDPGVAGRLWNDSNTLKISAG